MIIIDASGLIRFANRQVSALFGYPHEQRPRSDRLQVADYLMKIDPLETTLVHAAADVIGTARKRLLALVAMGRWREKPWPREGHGGTYFARPAPRQ